MPGADTAIIGRPPNITEAAYRFVRHEPGVDVVLFGTGDVAHLRANIESLLKPPLPEADRESYQCFLATWLAWG